MQKNGLYIPCTLNFRLWIYCVAPLSQTGYWETRKSTKTGSPFYNRWLQNARGGLCYWYASIIRAVIIGKSPLPEQAYLHVQGGRGSSAGYTPKWVSKTNQTKTTSESEIFWKLWSKKHFGQAHIKYSCIDIYSYSCLHPLSNERKSMSKSGDSRAVWTWVWTWKYLKWALHYLYGTHCGPDWSFHRCFCSRKRCVRLWCNDVRKYKADAILFREIQCKKMDNLMF